MPRSHTSSDDEDLSSLTSKDQKNDIEDMILNEPMYYILSQFLESDKNKNIATLLQELVTELKAVRVAITSLQTSQVSHPTSSEEAS